MNDYVEVDVLIRLRFYQVDALIGGSASRSGIGSQFISQGSEHATLGCLSIRKRIKNIHNTKEI